MGIAFAVLSAFGAGRVLLTDPGAVSQPFGSLWSLAFHFGLFLVSLVLAVILGLGMEDWPQRWQVKYFRANPHRGLAFAEALASFTNRLPRWLQAVVEYPLVVGLPLLWVIALTPVARHSITLFVVAAVLPPNVAYWMGNINLFTSGLRIHIFRPNEFVDMYDDPRSRHWLVSGAAGRIPAPTATEAEAEPAPVETA
jgi:hypothetical protein